jgi:beta-galactosidase
LLETALVVAAYVQGGGTAVAEARLAWNDDRGFASDVVPGFGLAEIFGACEKIIRPVEQPHLVIETGASLAGLGPQETIFAEAFEEELEPLGNVRVLARFANGQPAMVENSYGKGKAILVGSFLALAFERHAYASTGQLLFELARHAGVSPEVEVTVAGAQDGKPDTVGHSPSQIEIRRLVGERHQIVFVFNHAVTPMHATISFRLPWRAGEARNLEDDQKVPLQIEGGRTTFGKALAAGEIWIVLIRPE